MADKQEPKTNLEWAVKILDDVARSPAGPDDQGAAGAIVGVGYALLAIHDEIRTCRAHEEQRIGAGVR